MFRITKEVIGMTRREELQVKNVSQLRDIAKGYSVKGRWDMNKNQLVDAILEVEEVKVDKDAKVEVKIDNEEVVKDSDSKTEKEVTANEDKMRYVRDVKIGTIVAFTTNGTTRSAKVTNKSSSKQLLKLEDRQGVEYIIPYADVIWVRCGKRWPRGVYNALTGGKRNGKESSIEQQA